MRDDSSLLIWWRYSLIRCCCARCRRKGKNTTGRVQLGFIEGDPGVAGASHPSRYRAGGVFMFESMRKSAMRLVLVQAAAGAIAGAVVWPAFGAGAGVATFAGAFIGLLGSLFMVAGLMRVRSGATPTQMLARVLLGEAAKLVVCAVGFAVCIAVFDLAFLGLLAGFVATMLGYWAGLLPAVLGEGAQSAAPAGR